VSQVERLLSAAGVMPKNLCGGLCLLNIKDVAPSTSTCSNPWKTAEKWSVFRNRY